MNNKFQEKWGTGEIFMILDFFFEIWFLSEIDTVSDTISHLHRKRKWQNAQAAWSSRANTTSTFYPLYSWLFSYFALPWLLIAFQTKQNMRLCNGRLPSKIRIFLKSPSRQKGKKEKKAFLSPSFPHLLSAEILNSSKILYEK